METKRPWTIVESPGNTRQEISKKGHEALVRSIKHAIKRTDENSNTRTILEQFIEESENSRFTRGQRITITGILRDIN